MPTPSPVDAPGLALEIDFNGDLALIEGLDPDRVAAVRTGLGPGHPPLPQVVDAAHRRGLRVHHDLSAPCLDNREITRDGYRALAGTLQDLERAGVDGITVSLPFLVGVVREQAPGLAIEVGPQARVDSLPKARAYAELGVKAICLPSDCNRDLALLQALVRHLPCDLGLVANSACLLGCPDALAHDTHLAHGGTGDDPCLDRCLERLDQHPWELVRSPWIRPRDVGAYAAFGVRTLRIEGASRSTRSLLDRLARYQRGQADDLVCLLELSGLGDRRIRADALTGGRPLDPARLGDDFLDRIGAVDCTLTACEPCGVCPSLARDAR